MAHCAVRWASRRLNRASARQARRARRALARWARPRAGDALAGAMLIAAFMSVLATDRTRAEPHAAGAAVAGLLALAGLWGVRRTGWRLARGVAQMLAARMRPIPGTADAAPRDGAAYERLCAARLEAAGWRVQVTGPGPDQGLDLVARRGGRVAVIQCKRYGRPVGARAVQEIVAARPLVSRTAAAAVVATCGFTRGARALARVNDVALLSHDDLARWDAAPFRTG